MQNMPTHAGSKFSWDKTRGTAWASDLGDPWNTKQENGARTFSVFSKRSGATVVFFHTVTSFDPDDDVSSWTYVGTTRDGRDIVITVFND